MITENLSTLKIHKLTQAQYDRELAAGNLDEHAIYLTPNNRELITIEDIDNICTANPIITFTIEGIGYEAEEGMTWGEWIVSDYNTTGYILSEACSLLDLDRRATDNGANGACPDTVIEAGRVYDRPSEPM